MVQGGLVDSSVADEAVDRFGHAKFVEVLAKFSHRGKAVEFTVHGREVVEVKAVNFCYGLHLVEVSNSTDDVIFAGAKQS
jgi:hypothetical protein